ncbi:Imm1 family immunity protein [Streptomyces sp. NPDC086023]|uniref:Imm1 family immunity protein n=1 Tax=Streptomyces sp. NPDC086023 TaxID=3365746 RepID=UPI0037D4356A
MILSIHINETIFLRNEHEVAAAIDRALTMRSSGLTCDTSSFLYHKTEDPVPKEASLTVTVNHDRRCGGLVWYADGDTAERLAESGGKDFADSIWVSVNLDPLAFDPELMSDPWTPTYMHRTSALPIPVLRAAIEEFCRNGTGDRPTCIQWIEGNFDGTILE